MISHSESLSYMRRAKTMCSTIWSHVLQNYMLIGVNPSRQQTWPFHLTFETQKCSVIEEQEEFEPRRANSTGHDTTMILTVVDRCRPESRRGGRGRTWSRFGPGPMTWVDREQPAQEAVVGVRARKGSRTTVDLVRLDSDRIVSPRLLLLLAHRSLPSAARAPDCVIASSPVRSSDWLSLAFVSSSCRDRPVAPATSCCVEGFRSICAFQEADRRGGGILRRGRREGGCWSGVERERECSEWRRSIPWWDPWRSSRRTASGSWSGATSPTGESSPKWQQELPSGSWLWDSSAFSWSWSSSLSTTSLSVPVELLIVAGWSSEPVSRFCYLIRFGNRCRSLLDWPETPKSARNYVTEGWVYIKTDRSLCATFIRFLDRSELEVQL